LERYVTARSPAGKTTICRALIVVVGIAALGTGLSAGAGDDAAKADLKRLQGKWKAVSRMVDGRPAKVDPKWTWTISGDKFLFGGGLYAKMKLDPHATPKAIDWDHYDARDKPRIGEIGFKGIYAFEGEGTFKVCITGIAGRPRPRRFESKQGDGNIYLIYKRVKE
jgi:uncharacterized protein (TIGR03067 family)